MNKDAVGFQWIACVRQRAAPVALGAVPPLAGCIECAIPGATVLYVNRTELEIMRNAAQRAER